MTDIVGCNPMPDGTCRTLKEQYHKTSVANFLYTNDWGATGYIYMKPSRYLICELVGDRDKPRISIKDFAFCVPANPMSDRVQKAIVIYEC